MTTAPTAPPHLAGPSDEDRARLAAEVDRLKAEREQPDVVVPDRAGSALGAFRDHPAFRAALERTTDEQVAEQIAQLDRQAAAEREQLARTKRWDAYVETRRFDYATADYASLNEQQNPGGKVTAWWGSPHRTLLLSGPSSHGKTHAAYAIANEVATADREGRDRAAVRAWSVVELADALRPLAEHERRDENITRRQSRILDDVCGCDLLLLDDLGRESVSDWWRERLFLILDSRAGDRRRRTIITCNATVGKEIPVMFRERYGSPVETRVRQDTVAAWIEGTPMRGFAEWDPFS